MRDTRNSPMQLVAINRAVNAELWRIRFRAYAHGQTKIKQREPVATNPPAQRELF